MKTVKRILLNKAFWALLLTGTVLFTLLIINAPVQALSITFPILPASTTVGASYAFTGQITIQNTDFLPVQSVDLNIYNAASPSSYKVTCMNLPLPTAGSSSLNATYTSAGGTVQVTGSTDANWGYGYSSARYGYGYGYPSGTLTTQTLVSGYGYGYNNGTGATSITYTITWSSPPSWPAGSYNIQFIVHGDNNAQFTQGTAAAFTLNAASGGTINVGGITNSSGVFTQAVTVTSADGLVTMTIPSGTTGLTASGQPITQLSITSMTSAPTPPTGSSIIGLPYDFEPSGATFNPAITLTFAYNPLNVPAGASLSIAYYNTATAAWVSLPSTVNTANNTITAQVSHFTTFGIMGMSASTTTTAPVVTVQTTKAVTTTPVITTSKGTTTTTTTMTITPTGTTITNTHTTTTSVTTKTATTSQSNWWIVVIAAVVTAIVVTLVIVMLLRNPTK